MDFFTFVFLYFLFLLLLFYAIISFYIYSYQINLVAAIVHTTHPVVSTCSMRSYTQKISSLTRDFHHDSVVIYEIFWLFVIMPLVLGRFIKNI